MQRDLMTGMMFVSDIVGAAVPHTCFSAIGSVGLEDLKASMQRRRS